MEICGVAMPVVARMDLPTFQSASYYGDREADLAFTYMFGVFPPLYDAYENEYPLDSAALRKTLYNLYHEINHFNLFGGGTRPRPVEHQQTHACLMNDQTQPIELLSARRIADRLNHLAGNQSALSRPGSSARFHP